MHNPNETTPLLRRFCAAAALAAALLAPSASRAQDPLKLDPIAPEYKLGRFTYKAPNNDGWRQIANATQGLSLIYAEQSEDGKIETRFGVVLESHDVPPEANVVDAAWLAGVSRTQMAEARRADLVGISPVVPVPGVENMHTYRLLVHAPQGLGYDAYEVYYVALAPDRSQYVVAQCITKTQDYENQVYFNEFYASLPSLKYTGAAAPAPSAAALAPSGKADAPAPASGAAATAPSAPAPAAPAAGEDHSGHDHAGHDHAGHDHGAH